MHATWVPAEQKFQVHPEMLELLGLRVSHDRPRLPILLKREALLVS